MTQRNESSGSGKVNRSSTRFEKQKPQMKEDESADRRRLTQIDAD